jgi:hypothetical protein
MQTVHRLTIPRWHPARLNEIMGRHWAIGHKRKRADAITIGWHAKASEIPHAEGRRRVSLVIVLGPRQRAGDPDAYWKSTLDGLVLAGLLRNDSSRWCELGTIEFRRGTEHATEIILEDLDASFGARRKSS